VSKLRRLEFLVFHSISSWIFNLYTSSGCDKIPQSFRIKRLTKLLCLCFAWAVFELKGSGCDKIPQSFRIKRMTKLLCLCFAWAVFEFSTLNTKVDMLDLKACMKVLINLDFSLIQHFKSLFH